MSRKHFVALAQAIASIENVVERERAAELIGLVCRGFNYNFNWSVWYNACGVKQR
jgi:hypothetical protein